MSVASTCASAPGVASTWYSGGTSTTSRRPAFANVGTHTLLLLVHDVEQADRLRRPALRAPGRREEVVDDADEALDLLEEMRASSWTAGSSEASEISSSRMLRAVRGVRSWCDASAANWRSAASRPASRSELRASSAATRSISSTPEGSRRGRTCPEPSCSADAARYTSGAAMRFACHTAIPMPAANATIAAATTSSTTCAARR